MSYSDAVVCYLDVLRVEKLCCIGIRAAWGSEEIASRLVERGWLRWRAEDLVEAHPALRQLAEPKWLDPSN